MFRKFFTLYKSFALALLVALVACATPTATPVVVPTTAPPLTLDTPTPRVVNNPPTVVPTTQPPTAVAPTTESQSTAVAATNVPPPTAAPAPTQPPPPPPARRAPEAFFGVNTNGEILYNDQVRALAILGGVQMVRTSIGWSGVEKTKGEYQWGGADSTMKTLLNNNFAPLVLILDNPSWAGNSPCGPVNDLPAFDQFLRQAVARYPQVKYWVLYNEPDDAHYPDHIAGGCFGGQDINGNGRPDVQDYAEQLRIAWRAVHETNPNALLVMGALAMDNFDEASAPPTYPGGGRGGVFNARFLADLVAFMQANPLPNGERYLDVVSFNFYSIYGPYWQRQAQGVGIAAKTNFVRKLLGDAGINVPLMVGETGEDSYSIGNERQSENAVKTFVRGLASELTHIVWWTYQDLADSSPPPTNTWKYGLLDQDGKPKPMYAAYQTVSKQLTGATFLQALQVQGGEGYLFEKGGAGIGVVWSSSDAPVTIAFSANTLQVTDMYGGVRALVDGAEQDKDGTVGRVGVQVDKNPLYIQVAE